MASSPPRDVTPEQCPFCTAPASYLERIKTGWLCKCCAKVLKV